MSLLVTWDHPLEMTALAHTCRVLRGEGGVPCGSDVPWGVFEDKETNDERGVYTVQYLDRGGAPVGTILNLDIRRYERPAKSCKITFDIRAADGAPAAGRWFEMSDEMTGATMTRRMTLNSKGRGVFIAMYGARVLFRSEGAFKALDAVIPSYDTIDYKDLAMFGSWIDTDRRGWY